MIAAYRATVPTSQKPRFFLGFCAIAACSLRTRARKTIEKHAFRPRKSALSARKRRPNEPRTRQDRPKERPNSQNARRKCENFTSERSRGVRSAVRAQFWRSSSAVRALRPRQSCARTARRSSLARSNVKFSRFLRSLWQFGRFSQRSWGVRKSLGRRFRALRADFRSRNACFSMVLRARARA